MARARTSVRSNQYAPGFAYTLILPAVVLILMFSVYPLVMSWVYSFHEWDGLDTDMRFIGLDNFREISGDPFYWAAFWRSVIFAAVATPVQLAISLLFAVLLNNASLKLRGVYRTLIFIPVVTTTAIIGIVMSFVFAPFDGPVNEILRAIGITNMGVDLLGDPNLVLWTAIGIFVWKGCGQPMIYWLAGLQTVPVELQEAAMVDGAGWFRRLVKITIPMLAPFAAMITVIVTLANLQVFAFMQTLTRGGPMFAAELIELFIYRMAFGIQGEVASERLGYASAAGLTFGIALMGIGVIQILVFQRVRASRK